MDAWWVALLRGQQRDGFPDLTGTAASVTLPISDRLISRVIAARMPASVPIREIDLFAYEGDIITVRVRLTKPAFLPPLQLRLAIDEQPHLPSSPFLVLRVVPGGVASLATSALKFVDVLPPGVRFDAGRFVVDVAEVLASRGAGEVLAYLTELRVTTMENRVVVHVRAELPSGYSDRSM